MFVSGRSLAQNDEVRNEFTDYSILFVQFTKNVQGATLGFKRFEIRRAGYMGATAVAVCLPTAHLCEYQAKQLLEMMVTGM